MAKEIYVVGGEAEQSGVFGAFEKEADANAYADKLMNDPEGAEACVYKVILNQKTPTSKIWDTMVDDYDEEFD